MCGLNLNTFRLATHTKRTVSNFNIFKQQWKNFGFLFPEDLPLKMNDRATHTRIFKIMFSGQKAANYGFFEFMEFQRFFSPQKSPADPSAPRRWKENGYTGKSSILKSL